MSFDRLRRRAFITALGGAAAWPLAVRAQQLVNPRHVGVLLVYEQGNPRAQASLAAFQAALTQLGWTEGRNIEFEHRWVGTEAIRLQQAAQELVALQPDLILVPGSSSATAAVLQRTRTIPIVFANIVDPVGQGFAASLSRPGGNATGLINLEPSMAGKWLDLLKQVLPRVARVAIPFHPATSPYAGLYLSRIKSMAPSLGIEVVPGAISDMAAFEMFTAAQAREPNTGLIPVPGIFMSAHVADIVEMIARHRVPAIYYLRDFAQAGGLLSYGNDSADNYRRAATFVDRILKGERPSDLPIEIPVKFEMVINLKTARALGLQIADQLLALADEVVE